MNGDEIGFMTAGELQAAYAARTLSPVEVAEALLDRIEALDARFNAIVMATREIALDQARASEKAYAEGSARPLEGVPVTIKDMHPTKGLVTSNGSHATKDVVPTEDAPCISRLHAAGTVMLGKTAVPEFGWKGVSQGTLHGITHNPWKHGYNAGASSAGAAVASAVGYGPLHLGSDGGGSVRMPAHFSGVFGIKPTYGRVPYWPVPNNDYATHMGPLTRTVADGAAMLKAMAGPHPWDHTSLESPPADYPALLGAADMRGRRIAYSPDLGHARVDPDVAALVEEAVSAFEAMGAHVERVDPDWGPRGPDLARFFWPAGYLARTAAYLDRWRDRMEPALVAMMEEGRSFSAERYHVMRERKLAYVEAIHRFFQGYDLLLTPAVSVAAFPAERIQPEHWPQHPWDWLMWAEFSYPFNFSGNPAASVPCGFTEAGLPVGLQIVGPRFDDLRVLQASAAFEAARPWADRKPPQALANGSASA